MLLDELLPLGLLLVLDDAEPLPDGEDGEDGEVALLPVDPLTEPDPVVVLVELLLLGGVALGDADGGVVRSGVLPTRSVSVRLHATLTPASNASAQKPESIFFIADAPPCGVWNQARGLQRTCPRRLT